MENKTPQNQYYQGKAMDSYGKAMRTRAAQHVFGEALRRERIARIVASKKLAT